MMKKVLFVLIAIGAGNSLACHSQICQNHIFFEEKNRGIESGLLEAIATIESKLNPYVVNVRGRSYSFTNVQEAACFVRERTAQGVKNISVGPMQLHVPSHRHHFKSFEDMIDPRQNIAYAARLLKTLERKHGSREQAVRYYHSGNQCAGARYQSRVFGAWAKIRQRRSTCPVLQPVSAVVVKKGKNP